MPKKAKNTYKLPTGEPIRRALKAVFRSQRRQVLAALSSKKAAPELPDALPEFRLGNLAMSERMTPLIRVFWEQGGSKLLARHDLDPDTWEVRNPEVETAIEKAALDFSASTNATTSLALDEALKKTRAELVEGLFEKGESVRQLTKRVNTVFDAAETWRARRIAASEASRAVHAGQESAAIASGVVLGWEWLLSKDACPLCQTVARRARYVKLGQPFAINGTNPTYSEVRFPPLHPLCQCSVLEVVDQSELPPELRDPEPAWAETLVQPKPEAEDKPEPKRKPSKPAPQPAPPTPPTIAPPQVIVPPNVTPPPAPAVTPDPEPERKPITERIAEYADGDRKLQALKQLVVDTAPEAKALTAEISAFMKQPKGDRVQSAAVHGGLTERLENLKRAEAANRRAVLEVLGFPKAGTFQGTAGPTLSPELGGRVKEGAGFLRAITKTPEGGAIKVRFDQDKGRAYYKHKRLQVVLDPDSPTATVVHELGHALEHQLPGAQKSAQEFLAARRGDESLKPMGKGYAAHETGIDDDFTRTFGKGGRYVGKHYDSDDTEILSMGLEQLYANPARLIDKDPEFAKFLFGILDGSLR